MNSLTAVIIDDEFTALKGLQQKLEKLFVELKILDSFQKPEEAIQFLEKKQPDLVFLDIEMPRINGFELLGKLSKVDFQVIFVTAYNEYAIDAFKKNAIDYILKPVEDQELVNAVRKAETAITAKKEKEASENLIKLLSEHLDRNNKLMVPTSKGISFIPQEEILHLEGYDGYTKIHLIGGNEIVSSYNLGRFQKLLGQAFFKCHKSHIIHIAKVRSFENEGYLVLENHTRVPISRANRKVFLNLFG